MGPRREILLAALLLACSKPVTDSANRPNQPTHTGGECPQNHCVNMSSPAASAASGFPNCPNELNVEWSSQPNPRPFSAELTKQRKASGQAEACCYEVQRLCGGGRPLLNHGDAVIAPLAQTVHWALSENTTGQMPIYLE